MCIIYHSCKLYSFLVRLACKVKNVKINLVSNKILSSLEIARPGLVPHLTDTLSSSNVITKARRSREYILTEIIKNRKKKNLF